MSAYRVDRSESGKNTHQMVEVVHFQIHGEMMEAGVAILHAEVQNVRLVRAEDARHHRKCARFVLEHHAQARGAAFSDASPQARSIQSASMPSLSRSQSIVWTSISSPGRRRPTMRSPGTGWQHSARR